LANHIAWEILGRDLQRRTDHQAHPNLSVGRGLPNSTSADADCAGSPALANRRTHPRLALTLLPLVVGHPRLLMAAEVTKLADTNDGACDAENLRGSEVMSDDGECFDRQESREC